MRAKDFIYLNPEGIVYDILEVGTTDWFIVGVVPYPEKEGRDPLFTMVYSGEDGRKLEPAIPTRFRRIDPVFGESLLAFESVEIIELHQRYQVPDNKNLWVYIT